MNIMEIKPDQIAYLDALEQTGSLTAAAARLKRAKSAVYYSLKKLEEQLGFAVLETGAYRGRLTPKGIQFLRCAQRHGSL